MKRENVVVATENTTNGGSKMKGLFGNIKKEDSTCFMQCGDDDVTDDNHLLCGINRYLCGNTAVGKS